MLTKPKIYTTSIKISLLTKDDKIIDLKIPYSQVFVLELTDITQSIGHNLNGEYYEFLTCQTLNLKLYQDQISPDNLKLLKQHDILSLTLFFNNHTSKSYNVVWNLKANHNLYEKKTTKDNILSILISKNF